MRFVAVLLAALAASGPVVAHADESPSVQALGLPAATTPDAPVVPMPSSDPPPRKGRWYGWELMLSDALFLLLAVDGGGGRPELPLGSAGLPVGLAGGILVTPGLHLVHGNARRAGVSMLIRGGAIALFALAVDVWNTDDDNFSCANMDHCVDIDIGADELVIGGLALVAAGGAITYAVTEYFRFSRVPVAAPPQPRATVAPTAFMRPGGGGLGFVGSF